MDEVPLGLVRQALGLYFIVRYHSEPEVLGDWFSPIHVGVRRIGSGRYLQPKISGLTCWPDRGPWVSYWS
jgi:hypothetical protein